MLTARLARVVALSLRVAFGSAFHDHPHLQAGATLWSRGALRLETGAALVLRIP